MTRWKRYNETRERVFGPEAESKPQTYAERMPVDYSTLGLSWLAAAHRMALSQVRRKLPALWDFVRGGASAIVR